MSKQISSTRALGCLALVALPFAGLGVFMADLIGAAVLDWSAMQSWEEVPAELISVNLWRSRDAENSAEARATYG